MFVNSEKDITLRKENFEDLGDIYSFCNFENPTRAEIRNN